MAKNPMKVRRFDPRQHAARLRGQPPAAGLGWAVALALLGAALALFHFRP